MKGWLALSRRLADDRVFLAAWAATFLVNVAWGFIFPLRNLYIRDAGIPLGLIGTIGTAGMLAFNVAGLVFGWLSDMTGRRRLFIAASLFVAAWVSAAYLWARGYWQFLLLQILDLGMVGCYMTLISTRVTALLPPAEQGRGFGLYRMSGSFGFALASLSLGLITTAFGLRGIFAWGAAAYVLAFGASLWLTEEGPRRQKATAVASGMSVLRAPGLIGFFIASILASTSQYMVFPFFPIYLKDALAANEGEIGFLSTIGVLSEVPAMLYLGALSDRWGRRPLLGLAFALEMVRWVGMYAVGALWPVFIIQALAGMSQARYTLSTVFMSDLVPYERRATAIGLQQLVVGIGMVIAPALGGLVAEGIGVRAIFAVASLASGLATLLFGLTSLAKGEQAAG